MSVVVFHLFAAATPYPFWGHPANGIYNPTLVVVAGYGWVGVPLFFLISGFVICMSSWGRTPAQFGISRFVRLYPAYWFAVLLTTAVAVLHPHPWPVEPWRDVLTNLTMFQGPLGVQDVDAVYWTLWVELRFYLLFALVVWRGLTYRRVLAFCVAWAIASAWAPQLGLPWLKDVLIYDQSFYFIAGVALFLMYRFGRRPELWLLVGFSWVMAMHYYAANPWQSWVGKPYLPASILITICYVLMTVVALGKLDWIRWRGLTVLGAITYPLYLIHNDIGLAALDYFHDRTLLANWALTSIVIVALVVTAWLIHRVIERPLAPRLKRALSRAVDASTKPSVPSEATVSVELATNGGAPSGELTRTAG
jgi:peptidoglycan/LPS O-acetylase OafA/YrhL